MDLIISFFNWFWLIDTDSLIIPFAKANVTLIAVFWVIMKWWAKRTPSTEDDALIDEIRAVLPMMKRQ
jgi:hypothetical protein